jgi:hypothetical protein
MDAKALRQHIYDMTETEQFYKEYYLARRNQKELNKFLANLNMEEVFKKHLLVLEIEETIPKVFEDSFFFDLSNNDSIVVQKHERYGPAI